MIKAEPLKQLIQQAKATPCNQSELIERLGMKCMTVADLISFLQTQPQHLPVAYEKYSEHCLLTQDEIEVQEHCQPRPDGWIHYKRPDKPTQLYLVLPGN